MESFEQRELTRGASTITQQVVKNLFLTNERSIIRKIKEFFLSLEVERNLSKKRILEIYLNIIELGKGVYGIKNASYHYFNRHPSRLSPRQGAFLAMLLPSPIRYAQSFRKKELTPFAQSQIRSILGKLKLAKIISEEDMNKELESKFSWEYREEK